MRVDTSNWLKYWLILSIARLRGPNFSNLSYLNKILVYKYCMIDGLDSACCFYGVRVLHKRRFLKLIPVKKVSHKITLIYEV